MIEKFEDYIRNENLGMGSLYNMEYPIQYNTIDNPTDRGKSGNLEYFNKVNKFQKIQDEIKELIKRDLKEIDDNITEMDLDNELKKFLDIKNSNISSDIKRISDNCNDIKKCAKEIYYKYNLNNDVNNDFNIIESNILLENNTINGKFGFFMFLDIIEKLNNTFDSDNYLNISDFNIFFNTDKILDKQHLSDILEFSKSLVVAYKTIIKIRNLRLSFYFGVKNFILQYGFRDDIKNVIFKVGEFEMDSSFLKSLKSYKPLVLISHILMNVNLKELNILQNVKNDLLSFYDDYSDVEIIDQKRLVKKIKKDQIEETDKLMDIFDYWCFSKKWYYSVYNYVNDEDEFYVFYIKIKDIDDQLSSLKKISDIKNINEDVVVDILHQEQPSNDLVDIYEPLTKEPLNTPKLKINPNNKNGKNKELYKYLKDLKKVYEKIIKDINKDISYTNKHIYPLVNKYNKKFSDLKLDLYWLSSKLEKDPEFIEKYNEK